MLDLNVTHELVCPVADLLNRRHIPFIFATGYGAGGIEEAYPNRPIQGPSCFRSRSHRGPDASNPSNLPRKGGGDPDT
jgi:hypothetical protein